MTEQTASKSFSSIEETLELYMVKKAPFQLPDEAKEAIVKFGPWIMLILMILALPALLAGIGLTAVFAPVGMMAGRNVFSFVPTILGLAAMVLNIIALPGLFNRTKAGWKYAYYAQLVSIVSSVLSLQIAGAIISGLIGFYVLFQVKGKYTK